MFFYDLKSTYRNIVSKPLFFIVNILGLSAGITCVAFISLYIFNEIQYDKFHEKHENIYRIEGKIKSQSFPITPAPLANWCDENFSEIEFSSRIYYPFFESFNYLTYNENTIQVEEPLFVDPDFFEIFSFDIILGDPKAKFLDKYSIILTKSLAEKIFPNENPVGKTIKYNGKNFHTIVAIVKDPPSNSSIKFDILLSFSCFEEYNQFDLDNWFNSAYHTLIVCNTNPDILCDKINQLINNQIKDNEVTYSLNPFDDIHFSQESQYDKLLIRGNKTQLIVFLLIALSILFLAIFNFLNMSIALSSLKMKEMGISKVIGASRLTLIKKYIIDSVSVSLLAALIATALIIILFQPFNNLLQNQILLSQVLQFRFIIWLFLIGIFTGIIAGLYPALIFTKNSTIILLKANKSGKTTLGKWKGSLVVFQFITSIVLIITTIFLYKQMDFLQTKKLGFEKDYILNVPLTDNLINTKSVLQENLSDIPGVISTCFSDALPGQVYSQWRFNVNIKGVKQDIDVNHCQVSAEFVKTLGLNLTMGRDFDTQRLSDKNCYIVNEAFLKSLDLSDPFDIRLSDKKILGVVKDFNYNSLHQNIAPLVIRFSDFNNQLSVRIAPSSFANIKKFKKRLRNVINKIDPDVHVEIQFLNSQIEKLYKKEIKASRLVTYFSILAIIISCLGLLAMTLLTINSRTKEIGIRKVNGAKTYEIMTMLNKEFVKWVAIAFVIACPIAWYVMHKWLENFAYKTELSWWIFALAGIIAMGIALLTVSFQSWRAATRNPVESLRYE